MEAKMQNNKYRAKHKTLKKIPCSIGFALPCSRITQNYTSRNYKYCQLWGPSLETASWIICIHDIEKYCFTVFCKLSDQNTILQAAFMGSNMDCWAYNFHLKLFPVGICSFVNVLQSKILIYIRCVWIQINYMYKPQFVFQNRTYLDYVIHNGTT